MTSLLRMRARACYPGCRHEADEQAFVLDGDVVSAIVLCARLHGCEPPQFPFAIKDGGCMALSIFNVAEQALC